MNTIYHRLTTLAASLVLASATLFAQDDNKDILDERRVDEGIRQIENSNYNYFTNRGWETSWGTLSVWYVDVVLTNPEAKSYVQEKLQSKPVYDKFNDLNYKKKEGSLSRHEINEFNRYIGELIWNEIDRLYPVGK